LDSLLRFNGPKLVPSLTELAESGQARADSRWLEKQLQHRGVRQNILDNLEISRLHFRRGMLILDHILHTHDLTDLPESVQMRVRDCLHAQWEHLFGLTFLSFIATGLIAEDAPGVDLMLPWMRRNSRQVHAHGAEEELRTAA